METTLVIVLTLNSGKKRHSKSPIRSRGLPVVNVNIQMLKKWKIKMYKLQLLLLSCWLHKRPLFLETTWRFENIIAQMLASH